MLIVSPVRFCNTTPKTAVVKRIPTGKWFVNSTVELCEKDLQEKHVPQREEEVGIDVG
jgi:putative transposase